MQGWTLLFFLYAEDDDTKKYAQLLIDDLKRTERHEQLTLLLFESVFVASGQNHIHGRLFRFIDGNGGFQQQQLLQDFGEVNPGEESVLSKVLLYLKQNQLVRERFVLFTWDHGSGFGVFDGDPRRDDARFFEMMHQPDRNVLEETGHPFNPADRVAPSFKVVKNRRPPIDLPPGAVDDVVEHNGHEFLWLEKKIKINMLTNTEINNALSVLERKTDLVIMMNCWMQMLETAFELAPNVNFLVAAETVHFFAGYDYASIIDSIAQNPEVTPEEVARIAVDTIENHFARDEAWREHVSEIIISALRLQNIGAMEEAINRTFEELVNNMNNHFEMLYDIRSSCTDFTSGYFVDRRGNTDPSKRNGYIDFYNYLALLHNNNLIRDNDMDLFQEIVRKVVIRIYCGSRYWAQGNKGGSPLAIGLSIFHPQERRDFDKFIYYDFFYRSGLVKLSRGEWGRFLAAYRAGF